MKKKIISLLVCIGVVLISTAQNLQQFTVTLTTQGAGSNYLGIANKKVYSAAEAKTNKEAIDLALLNTSSWSGPKMEWYNMSGKDDKIPAELRGTATMINAISLDKDQFTQCKTNQDFKRMTGHITSNSFSHYASVGEKEVAYHCFIVQLENGKRGLLWLEAAEGGGFNVVVKMQL